MLYGGYHIVANTSWSWSNHGQALTEKFLCGGHFHSEHNIWHRLKSWENKSKLLFDFQMVLFDRLLNL